MVLLCLPPHGQSLGLLGFSKAAEVANYMGKIDFKNNFKSICFANLDASRRVKHGNSPIKNTKRPFHLQSEVNMSCKHTNSTLLYTFILIF